MHRQHVRPKSNPNHLLSMTAMAISVAIPAASQAQQGTPAPAIWQMAPLAEAVHSPPRWFAGLETRVRAGTNFPWAATS
jgi:hypothetical protein